MNERDKELAEQAGCQSVVLLAEYGRDGLCDFEVDELNSLQKFADLIRADERDRMCERFNLSKELAHEKAKGNETD